MSKGAHAHGSFNTSTIGAEVYHAQLARLSTICASLVASKSRKIDYRKVTETLAQVFESEGADIHLRTITEDYFISCASYGEHFGMLARGESLISSSTGRMAEMLKTGEPLIMDLNKPDMRDKKSRVAGEYGYQSAVSTPIALNEQIIGFFTLSRKRPWQPTRSEIEYLLVIGRILGVALQNTAHILTSTVALSPELDASDLTLLTLISQGLSYEEIGTQLFCSLPTVKRRTSALLRKLGVETRTQAAVLAAHAGLV